MSGELCSAELRQLLRIGAQHVALHHETGVFAFTQRGDESSAFQLLGVVRHGRRADRMGLEQFGAWHRLGGCADLKQNLISPVVGECSGNQRDLLIGQGQKMCSAHEDRYTLVETSLSRTCSSRLLREESNPPYPADRISRVSLDVSMRSKVQRQQNKPLIADPRSIFWHPARPFHTALLLVHANFLYTIYK